VWLLAGYSFLVGASLQATNIYLPLFGHEALGLDVARAGYCAALVGGVGLLSRLAWSAAFDRLRRPHLLLVWLAVSGPLGVGAFVVAAETHTSALLWLGAAFHGATTVAASIMVMLVLIRTIEPERVGSTSGIVNTGHFAGYAAGPVAFGWLVDASGSYTLAWAAAAALYLGGAVLALRFPRGPVVPSEEPAAAATPSPAG
jgi:cyanate permease